MSDELNNRRNRVAQRLCNAILNIVATKTYRNFIDGAIRLGMASAAQKVQMEDPAEDRTRGENYLATMMAQHERHIRGTDRWPPGRAE